MSALDPRNTPRRFADRVRWAPMCFIADTDDRPVQYITLPAPSQLVVRITTSVIYRITRTGEPL